MPTLADTLEFQRWRKTVRSPSNPNPTYDQFIKSRDERRFRRELLRSYAKPVADEDANMFDQDIRTLSPDKIVEMLKKNAKNKAIGEPSYSKDQIRALIRQKHIARNRLRDEEKLVDLGEGAAPKSQGAPQRLSLSNNVNVSTFMDPSVLSEARLRRDMVDRIVASDKKRMMDSYGQIKPEIAKRWTP